ncbi:MAG: protein-tyrosine phosphatase family protein [Alphaproteobacteria bacterium]|nr:protein-tyrosine phosphatase family protein [Alphaproteobacteria bacterium]
MTPRHDQTISENPLIPTPPYNGPLHISAIKGPNGSVLGLTNCPGRRHRSLSGKIWDRNLSADFETIEKWNADALISLNQNEEFTMLGVPEFTKLAKVQNFDWYHLPIHDFGMPGPEFNAAWDRHGSNILQMVNGGARLIIHCAYGLGRSGTFAAKILTAFNICPKIAIEQVRSARPGAIESLIQEQYILTGGKLSS